MIPTPVVFTPGKRKRGVSRPIVRRNIMAAMEVEGPRVGADPAGVPVSLTSNSTTNAGKVMLLNPEANIGLKDRVRRNVATFRWQACAPEGAESGANMVPNFFIQEGPFTGQNNSIRSNKAQWIAPVVLYDLTCAPNFCDTDATNASAVQLNIRNTPVCVQPRFGLGGLSSTQYNVQDVAFEWRDYLSQKPNGSLNDNKWELDYLKKPLNLPFSLSNANTYAFLSSNTTIPGSVAGNPVSDGYSADMVDIGCAYTGQDNNDNNVVKSLIPPVGREPVHLSTNIKLKLYGRKDDPTIFDVMVFTLNGNEEMHPYGSKYDFLQNTFACKNRWNTGRRTVPSTTSPSEQETNAVKFWSAFAGEYGLSAGMADKKLVGRHINVIRRKTIRVDPHTNVSDDNKTNTVDVSFDLNWNQIRNYQWMDKSWYNMPTIGNVGGSGTSGFATKVRLHDTCSTITSPNTRVYLAVRVRSYNPPSLGFGEAGDPPDNWALQNISGLSNVAIATGRSIGYPTPLPTGVTTQGVTCPTYDIVIRNTFELDD